MYAIVETGGKQYRVSEGTKVKVERLSGNADDQVALGQVLVVNDGENTLVGSPYVEGASVTGKIVAQGKAKKVIVFKYKRRKDSKKKKGHRQAFTEIVIEKIQMEATHGA
jgi:large subunit ribosomal protein L21